MINSMRNSQASKQEPQPLENKPKQIKDNLYENQKDRMLNKPLRANTLNDNYFLCKERRQNLEDLMIKSVQNYNFDDSSDEDDFF